MSVDCSDECFFFSHIEKSNGNEACNFFYDSMNMTSCVSTFISSNCSRFCLISFSFIRISLWSFKFVIFSSPMFTLNLFAFVTITSSTYLSFLYDNPTSNVHHHAFIRLFYLLPLFFFSIVFTLSSYCYDPCAHTLFNCRLFV